MLTKEELATKSTLRRCKVKGAVFTLLLVVAIAATLGLVFFNYQIDRQVNGWKTRAQVSSEPNDMLAWMTNVKEGMERWGMTSGYAALIFRTPKNDMSLIYKTLINHVEQAQRLTTMDRLSPEYQTGLDNLRGSIRELDLQANYFWLIHDGLLLFAVTVVLWILVVGWLIVWAITV